MKRALIILLEILAAVSIYLFAASAMTWPMVAEMDTQVVGGGATGQLVVAVAAVGGDPVR